MNKRLGLVSLVLLIVVGLLLVSSLYPRGGQRIRVGGKNFTEQTIVGEMVAILIEERAGLPVERRFRLASNLPFKMLKAGDLDLYLDYTGTGFADMLGRSYRQETREEIYRQVKEACAEQFGMEWLQPLGFANTYTLTMRRKHARELGISRISDLARHADSLRAGFDPAFLDRQDGYPGLTDHYGFRFAHSPSQLAIGLMYKACREEHVDVINAFSTDGRISMFDLVVLEDDKHFFPPYDAALVCRRDLLGEHSGLVGILSSLSGKIDDDRMRRLNATVDHDGRQEPEVARQFLMETGLLPRP
ncbi:MAG: glycine/betaine ABC transporter substrate-binding protein [Gemmatimonadales bacterium]|nr:MAG: glycine/betaine ABC transporter substrate-binding protein [Gemmatimonadales bacterium]